MCERASAESKAVRQLIFVLVSCRHLKRHKIIVVGLALAQSFISVAVYCALAYFQKILSAAPYYANICVSSAEYDKARFVTVLRKVKTAFCFD